jgi:hypothetical protein
MHANVCIKEKKEKRKERKKKKKQKQKWPAENSVKWTRKHQGSIQQHAYVEMETNF